VLHRIAIALLLTIACAANAVAAGEPLFEPGPGLRSLDSAATGVFELGSVRFGKESGRLQALVHHGRVLQVHCRYDGRWLAKRGGSSGGKAIAPTKFDELSAIAGGLNQDVRRAPAATRESFARAAGLVFFDDAVTTSRPLPASRISSELFVVSSDPENGRWSFEGYGIVAIWPLPQPE